MTGVARYLTQAWFDEINHAAQNDESLRLATAGTHLTLQQVVTDGPEGERRYWLQIEDGSVRVAAGDSAESQVDADATFTQSYTTAVAVNRGELSTEDAFLDGRIRLHGDIGVLLRNQGALHNLGAAFAEVRNTTEYS